MGGKSPEHEISLISGREVVANLDPQKYDVLPIVVFRDGITWQIGDREQFLLKSPTSKAIKNQKSKVKSINRSNHASIIKKHKVDVVFIAMHGSYGEDGIIQGFLELIDVPYTGSGVLASALGMDKIYSRRLFTQSGIKIPKFLILTRKDDLKTVWEKFQPSVFVKPSDQGSSIGASKVSKKSDLKKALQKAFSYSEKVLVDKYIQGTEITIGVLGNEQLTVLPPVEIVPKNDFFDYEAKYNESKCDEICPARISRALTKKAQKTAIKTYQALGCQGFGRVDMIIKSKDVYVLEVNTIPGLTPVSLLPKAAAAAGISYPQLLDRIIALAIP